jgi:hypothetical protein
LALIGVYFGLIIEFVYVTAGIFLGFYSDYVVLLSQNQFSIPDNAEIMVYTFIILSGSVALYFWILIK